MEILLDSADKIQIKFNNVSDRGASCRFKKDMETHKTHFYRFSFRISRFNLCNLEQLLESSWESVIGNENKKRKRERAE